MKIGFIDYYLDEWHANNYPAWIKDASKGEMEVTLAYGLIDGPDGRRTNAQWCADMGIAQADSIEQIIAECDAIIVLSPDNCEMHEQLCQLPLRSKKPVYVDKTFAPDYETAKRIFDIAEESGTPCYSTSALRYASEYQGIENVRAISSWGPNGFEIYSIHQLEPIVMLMKADAKRVMYLPGDQWYSITIEFTDGRIATLTGYAQGSPFMMNIACEDGAKLVEVKSDFFHEFIVQLVEFFKDPSKVVPHEETLRIMAVRGAGLKAIEAPGTWIEL
ncbi:MAG: Gfo/Idh/MocA family oxidoreductase [Clostridia bacterium]|nr:Gfo/Idh/MocA family oxidoreductase [Clostridia bacterium]